MRNDEECGAVCGLQQVFLGQQRVRVSWRLAILHVDRHPTASWLVDESEGWRPTGKDLGLNVHDQSLVCAPDLTAGKRRRRYDEEQPEKLPTMLTFNVWESAMVGKVIFTINESQFCTISS